jgi:hypothetical protein
VLRASLKIVSALALSLAAPAMAAPSAPDPARMAAADKLLDAMHYDSLIERTSSAYIAEAKKTFPAQLEQRLGQQLPKELKDKLFAVIAQTIRKSVDENRVELRRGTAMIYASRFTTAEIEHLTRLQSDPVMVKMQQEMPQIVTESAALGQAALQRELPGLTSSIEQVVKDYYAEQKASPAT